MVSIVQSLVAMTVLLSATYYALIREINNEYLVTLQLRILRVAHSGKADTMSVIY